MMVVLVEGNDGDVVGCVLDGESRETLGVKREKDRFLECGGPAVS